MIERSVVLLDGGMGQELIRRSNNEPTPLWSARVLLDEPDLVEAVHYDFLRAGGRVVTLNTYAATPERLARDDMGHVFEALHTSAIDVAERAIARAGIAREDVTIAGCLSPLAGSYHPEQAPPDDEMRAIYDQVVAQQLASVDVFKCETLASLREIRNATAAAAATGKPVWTAMTVNDNDGTKLRSGENVIDAEPEARNAGGTALLVNCSRPEAVQVALEAFPSTTMATGAYANGFTSVTALDIGGTVDVLEARTDLTPEAYAEHALGWVRNGAQIVGGCCEVGPDHIAVLHEALKSAGYAITHDLDVAMAA